MVMTTCLQFSRSASLAYSLVLESEGLFRQRIQTEEARISTATRMSRASEEIWASIMGLTGKATTGLNTWRTSSSRTLILPIRTMVRQWVIDVESVIIRTRSSLRLLSSHRTLGSSWLPTITIWTTAAMELTKTESLVDSMNATTACLQMTEG